RLARGSDDSHGPQAALCDSRANPPVARESSNVVEKSVELIDSRAIGPSADEGSARRNGGLPGASPWRQWVPCTILGTKWRNPRGTGDASQRGGGTPSHHDPAARRHERLHADRPRNSLVFVVALSPLLPTAAGAGHIPDAQRGHDR